MNKVIDFGNIYIIPEKENIEEYLQLAGEHGLHFEYNDFFLPAQLKDQEAVKENIDFYKKLNGLPEDNNLHGSFLDVTIFSNDEKIREISEFRVRQSMDIATRIGAKAVIFHTNFIPNFHDEVYENNWLNSNVNFFTKVLEEYPGVSVYIENMFDMEPYMLKRLAESMSTSKYSQRFGVCLDYAHVNVFGTGNAQNWIKELAPYVKHIHINDNDKKYDRHWALGEGSIDYIEFFEYYKQYFKDVTVLIEVKGIEKVRQSLEYIMSLE